jgi:hypothetical protein
MASGPRFLSTAASAANVGRFGRFELALQVAGAWKNPFDPSEADVSVEFTSPSGRKSHVPAFYTQDFERSRHRAEEDRRSIQFLKFYVAEKEWRGASDVEFFFSAVTLVNSRTGAQHLLDDMQTGDVNRWGSDHVSWETGIVHGGSRSLRFAPKITDVEHWPGATLACQGADWSGYDGLVFWVYPRYKGNPGALSLYFADRKGPNSLIDRLSVGNGGLQPDRWNRVVWSWRGFSDSVRFTKKGDPHWQVRFAPTEVGAYRYRVIARDSTGVTAGPSGRFACVASSNPGFVRISPKDPRYFIRDDGKPFFPIGHDVSWDLNWAARAFPKMAAHGENATYCILIPWENCIEWGALGWYDLERAAKVDALIELAAVNGIYLKLSFDVHDALRRGASWEANPYSSLRGGPCNSPNDFYTDANARELYRRRLRYMIARWGYSPNVMAWETVAEIDGATEMQDHSAGWNYPTRPGGNAVSQMLVVWLREMHAFMRTEDPYGRLLTVCLGGDVSDPQLWRLPEVQYVQLHHYDTLDPGRTMPEWCARLNRFGKPFLVTESGWWADWNIPVHDPTGLCQHDGLWASTLGGASGSAYSWWWEQIDALNLYPYYAALHRFTAGVAWPDEGFHAIRATCSLPKPDHFNPVTITPKAPFDGGTVSRFFVKSTGEVGDFAQVPQILLAPDRRKTAGPVFLVNCPVPGDFIVHFDTVCVDSRLEIKLDGHVVAARDLPVLGVAGKRSSLDEKWRVWSCQYDEDLVARIPSGRHEIEVENVKPGGSWIKVTSYSLSHYGPPSLNVVGLTGRTQTLVWLQNTESTWWNAELGLQPRTIVGASVVLEGVKPGRYSLEWWDTISGCAVARSVVRAASGRVNLKPPPIHRDLACKLKLLGN